MITSFEDLKAVHTAAPPTEIALLPIIELADPGPELGDQLEYVVLFEGYRHPGPGFWGGDITKPVDTTPVRVDGYYAKYQPDYNWSFTPDINLANRYKSKKGALAKAKHGQRLFTDMQVTLVPVRLSTRITRVGPDSR